MLLKKHPWNFVAIILIVITALWLVETLLLCRRCQCDVVCDVNNTESSTTLDSTEYEESLEPVDSSEDLRIVVWVLTGPSTHMTKALHVKRTWGSHFDKLLFMSSTADERIGTIALPGVTEGHNELWPKTQKAFEYVWEHYKDDADWVMKADDDTFVVSHNLRDFLKDLDPKEPHYFGYNLKYNDVPVPVNFGGTGYILSMAAVKLFLDALRTGGDCHSEIRKIYKGDEDTELGICLASMNVTAGNAVDAEGKRQMIMVEYIADFDQVVLNFNGSWPNASEWSVKPVSFHRVSPSQMYLLEQLAHTMKIF